jgi:hypothetical protein
MRRITAVLALLLFPSPLLNAQGVPSSRAGDRPTYRHAYYLFLSGTPNGCEDCTSRFSSRQSHSNNQRKLQRRKRAF